jgi:dipeptidyl aminopeptidase/acylaminoacyl peptidase
MTVSIAILLSLVTLAEAPAQATPAVERRPGTLVHAAPSMERFMKIRAPSSPTLAPDRALYVIDWPDGINQLYRRPAHVPIDGPMEKLTRFEDGINSYSLSPDGRTIIVSAATGGSEQNDLHRLDTATGTIEPLHVDPSVVYGFQRWLHDSSGFVYSANDASPSDFHLYRHDLESGTSKTLLDRGGYWVAADVAADGRRLLVGRYRSASQADTFELDGETGALSSIDFDGGAFNWPVAYMPGETSAAFISDSEDGIRRLFVRDFVSGELSKPLPDLDAFPIEGGVVNTHRTLGAIAYNEGGYGSVRIVALPTFETVPMPEIERGVVGDLDFRGRYLSWTLSNARTPGLAYFCKAARSSEAVPLTVADDQGIDLSRFTLPRLVEYESFDGRAIPAFLYTPPGHEPGTPIPFVVYFHGGPEGQTRPRFSRTVQYLLTRGFGVMQPNVRGSTGYGRAFHRLDDYRNRWDSVRDGAEAARWLVRERYAEAGRIAAYGGSYGGFMAVAAVIEGADVFGASVNVVGIVNFRTFLEQTKDYRRALREAEYGPLSDPEFLESISPINRLDEIRVPMLIAHGLNDPRVPVGEAMQLAVGLQRRGYDPELLFFPDEGHGFAKLENRLLFYERMAKFLEREIGP